MGRLSKAEAVVCRVVSWVGVIPPVNGPSVALHVDAVTGKLLTGQCYFLGSGGSCCKLTLISDVQKKLHGPYDSLEADAFADEHDPAPLLHFSRDIEPEQRRVASPSGDCCGTSKRQK